MGKAIEISDAQAEQLARLASENCLDESETITRAFNAFAGQNEFEAVMREQWETLNQLRAEYGETTTYTITPPLDPNTITVLHVKLRRNVSGAMVKND